MILAFGYLNGVCLRFLVSMNYLDLSYFKVVSIVSLHLFVQLVSTTFIFHMDLQSCLFIFIIPKSQNLLAIAITVLTSHRFNRIP